MPGKHAPARPNLPQSQFLTLCWNHTLQYGSAKKPGIEAGFFAFWRSFMHFVPRPIRGPMDEIALRFWTTL